MVTRFHVGSNRPPQRLTFHVSLVSPLPKSYRDAFCNSNWQNSMRDEYNDLIKNNTLTLVHCPPDANIVRCMWLFPHKYLANCTRSRYKAWLVANGSTQLKGIDVDETFSLVVKPGMIQTDSLRLFLSKKKYAVEILEHGGMVNCNPSQTPVDTESKLGDIGNVVSDPTLYRSLAGSLQYLTFTRPDIAYVVHWVCLHMHDPQGLIFQLLIGSCVICGTLDYGLQFFSLSTIDLVAYSDADWASCPTTRRSTSGYCVFLGNNLLSWSSNRQLTLSHSSVEAMYRSVANTAAKTFYLSTNPIQHQRMKHIEIDIHFVGDLVAARQVRVLHVRSRYQYANIFTKGLPLALFEEFRISLSIRCPPAPTTEGCQLSLIGLQGVINVYALSHY
nr:ribonuclease H-like domain-containing protein [Tanacetum cinerariifolium]